MSGLVTALAVFNFLVAVAVDALAGGYSLPDQTARSMGEASAVTAAVEDPSAVYFNPAALTEIRGNQVLGGLNYINPHNSVTNSGRKSLNNHEDNFITDLFANYQVPKTDVSLGLGLYTPFGLATGYDEHSFTRYAAIRSELKTLYITPSFGWRINPHISIGGGVSFVHGSTELTRAVFVSPLLPDARIRITGTDNAFAYNLGLLVMLRSDLKFGLTFRSRGFLDFAGADVKYVDPLGARTKTTISHGGTVPLPAMVSAGINWKVNTNWNVAFTYDWTKWNDFKALTATFASPLPVLGIPTIPGLSVPEDWKNTSTLRFGTTYRLLENLDVRAGLALDETPIPARTLSPAIPGADLLAVTLGIGYSWNKLKLDAGYAALFNKTRTVSNNTLEGNPALTPGTDKYQTFTNFVFLGASYSF